MADALFSVSHVGPHTSIQDAGRRRLLRFGVSASGPMDSAAFAIANAALANGEELPVIEISLGGLVLDCLEGSVTLAIAGGGFNVAIGAARQAAWTVATIRAGSRLSVKPGAWGSWACLAFAGRLRCRHWLGSCSTHGQSGLGGGVLSKGSRIAIENAEVREEREGEIAPPPAATPAPIRVVLGPQDRFFGAETIATFLSRPFVLTDAYDRMGVRLSGPDLRPASMLDMPSEAILRGSVQVAGDGVATVLLADHQTTGGYPKIATVISADLDRFAQLRSQDEVRFQAVEPSEAVRIARAAWQARGAYLAGLGERRSSLAQRLMSLNLIDGAVSG